MFSPHKNKTKILSLVSSIVLWVYVTNVVDPTETKTYIDIPITVSNTNLIQENNLNIFPEKQLTANITIKTNLSKLKKISKDSIIIYGNINNPSPGKNILTLSSNLPSDIHCDIHADDLIVNLEFYKTIEKDITIIANKKYTSDDYEINIDKETIEVSGTTTIVLTIKLTITIHKIDKVVVTIKGNDTDESFNEKLEVIPLDINGNKIEGLKLSNKYINADVTKIIKEDKLNNKKFSDVQNSINKTKDDNSKNNKEK